MRSNFSPFTRRSLASTLVRVVMRRHLITGGICLAAILLAGCTDGSALLEPSGPAHNKNVVSSAEALPVVYPLGGKGAAPARGRTIRDEFAAMAKRVPGGFGGIHLVNGVLHIVLRDPSKQALARVALAREPLIQARRRGRPDDVFNPDRAEIGWNLFLR